MDVTKTLMMLAASITAITVIFIAIKKISIIVKRFIHFLDDYFGEEERTGFPGRPGMQERLVFIENEMKLIVYELSYNSGSSIKDAIGRIEKQVNALEEK